MQINNITHLVSYQEFNNPKQTSGVRSEKQLNLDTRNTNNSANLTPQKQDTQRLQKSSNIKEKSQVEKDIENAMGNLDGYVGIARRIIDGKYTIWGKRHGDNNMISKEESAKIFDVFREYGAVFTGKALELLESTELSVSEFVNQYTQYMIERNNNPTIDTEIKLDSSFSDYGSYKPQNSTFKPIQVNRDSITYDITKDEKFAFKKELLKQEQKQGIDVLFLTQKLEENSEKVIDKKV